MAGQPKGSTTPPVEDKSPQSVPLEGQRPNLEAGGDVQSTSEILLNASRDQEARPIVATDRSAGHTTAQVVEAADGTKVRGMEWTDKTTNQTFFRTPDATYTVTRDASGKPVYTPNGDNANARPLGRKAETDTNAAGAIDAQPRDRRPVVQPESSVDAAVRDRKPAVDLSLIHI